MKNIERVNLLIVDDDEIDALTMTRALSKVLPVDRITVAHSGAQGLSFLKSGKVARPYIVLVDISMPEMNGHEFVAELRKDEALRKSVVFIVTTSFAEEDIEKAYEQCVAGYIVKNADGADFRNVVDMLRQYISVVELPN
jgi:CheY-like chemotaxis protein